jgi:hypothetical protein
MAFRRSLGVFVCLAACGAAADRYANIYGRILDTSGAGIAQASVTVVNEDNGFRRVTESELGGAYAVGFLQPGTYKITVRKPDFHTVERYDLKAAAAVPTRADFVLTVGPVETIITVSGDPPQDLERTDASTGTRLEREDFEHLPLNGGGVLKLLEMAPGTNVTPATRGEAGQFTTSGQRANANYFMVDGVSANTGVAAGGLPAQATGGSLPALSAFGSLDSLISLEAVQEFRVTTSTSMAELGRLPGAIVALHSRSGSNEFHGASNYRVRNELFSGNDWFANQSGLGRLPLRLQDFTQTLGGPIRRNRTFFFASIERMTMRQPYTWLQPVPSNDARSQAPDWTQPLLSLFPAPTGSALTLDVGESVGRAERPADLTTGALRIDQAIGSRVSLFGRYNDSPSTNDFGTLAVDSLDLRSRSLTLAVNARPTGRLVLDFRANESQAQTHSVWTTDSATCALQPVLVVLLTNVDAPCQYLMRFTIGGIGQLVSGPEGDRRQRQFQTVNAGTFRTRSHNIGFGADYRSIVAIRRDPTAIEGLIADSISDLSNQQFWKGSAQAQNASIDVHELSLWAQDTWQASSRLTVTGGLRWEFSPAPPDAKGQPIWPTTYRNFAPRLAVAYRLTSSANTVLRAGAGLYYDSSLTIATDQLNGGPLSIDNYGKPFGLRRGSLTYDFEPGLRLPLISQWNIAVAHAFTASDVLTVGYLGSSGRRLLRRQITDTGINQSDFPALTTNYGYANYHALQAEYRRRVAHGFEATASYAWSHSIDNDSSDAFLLWATPGFSDRGSSDFDLRHSLTATLSYEYSSKTAPAAFRNWALDGVFRARTGFPISVLDSEEYLGINFVNAFRPNLIYGVPLWIGGKLNPAAFSATTAPQQGTLGRNAIGGFGMSQLDLALRREFRFTDRQRLQFRIEAFNILNHPNFADPVRYLNSPVFGQSTSMLNMMLGTGSPGSGLAPILQTGGSRSLQGTLRFQF